jgi:hypothetical protein
MLVTPLGQWKNTAEIRESIECHAYYDNSSNLGSETIYSRNENI